MKDMTATAAEAAKVQERIKELTDYLDLLKADLRDHLAPGKKLTVYTPNSEYTVSVTVRKDSVRLDTTALKKEAPEVYQKFKTLPVTGGKIVNIRKH